MSRREEIDGPRIRVRARSLGYYLLKRRYPGDVFDLEPVERPVGMFDKTPAPKAAGDEKIKRTQGDILREQIRHNPLGKWEKEIIPAEAQFSENWMERVDTETPVRETSAGKSLERQRQEMRAGRAAA